MPSYSEHKKFVNSKPYDKWDIIQVKNKKIGSIYLTPQNEIGIFIKKISNDRILTSKLCL